MILNSKSLSAVPPTRGHAAGGVGVIRTHAVLLLLLLFTVVPCAAQDKGAGPAATQAPAASGGAQRWVKEGVAVEFRVRPLEPGKSQADALVEGQDVSVEFKVTDAATGAGLSGVRPSVWIDGRDGACEL